MSEADRLCPLSETQIIRCNETLAVHNEALKDANVVERAQFEEIKARN